MKSMADEKLQLFNKCSRLVEYVCQFYPEKALPPTLTV